MDSQILGERLAVADGRMKASTFWLHVEQKFFLPQKGSSQTYAITIWVVKWFGLWGQQALGITAHLDDHKRGLSVGDYVKKGDLIGYVGNTGNARHTAPHLHYGLYLQGKGRGAVNPYPYLR
jgi:hypothetical protein